MIAAFMLKYIARYVYIYTYNYTVYSYCTFAFATNNYSYSSVHVKYTSVCYQSINTAKSTSFQLSDNNNNNKYNDCNITKEKSNVKDN